MLTCDDIDIRVHVFREAHSCTVLLKGIAKLLLHCCRATQTVQPHHLGTQTEKGCLPAATGKDCWGGAGWLDNMTVAVLAYEGGAIHKHPHWLPPQLLQQLSQVPLSQDK